MTPMGIAASRGISAVNDVNRLSGMTYNQCMADQDTTTAQCQFLR